MTVNSMVRYGGGATALAGALRIVSSFIPYEVGSVSLEWFYLLIDVSLLLGLLSLFIYHHEQCRFRPRLCHRRPEALD